MAALAWTLPLACGRLHVCNTQHDKIHSRYLEVASDFASVCQHAGVLKRRGSGYFQRKKPQSLDHVPFWDSRQLGVFTGTMLSLRFQACLRKHALHFLLCEDKDLALSVASLL